LLAIAFSPYGMTAFYLWRVKMCRDEKKSQNYLPTGIKICFSSLIIELAMKSEIQRRSKGRPRSFDVEKALNRALEVFRREGYEGATLTDLTTAMGIERPSLYAAFGDKEGLFRKALDLYEQRLRIFLQSALEEKTARGFVERLLRGAADFQADPDNPPGCLTVQGALACGKDSEPIRKELISRREQLEAAVCKRLKQDKREGDLPEDSNPVDLARYIVTIIHGMSVQAAGGASRRELQRIVDAAMRGWPQCTATAAGV
jgi:AcrR family transcriptional regulator